MDMFEVKPTETDITRAAETALAAEAIAEVETCDDFSLTLTTRLADEDQESEWVRLARIDGFVCSLFWQVDTENDRPLEPFAESRRLIDAISDDLRPYFEQRANETGVAELRARYLEILWNRWQDGRAAGRAIEAYLASAGHLLASARALPDPNAAHDYHDLEASDRFVRASQLALALGRDTNTVAAAIHEAAPFLISLAAPGPGGRLLDGSAGLLAQADPEVGNLIGLVLDRATAAGAAKARWVEQCSCQSAERLATKVGNAELAKQARRARAQSLENEASEVESGIVAGVHLTHAIEIRANLGDSEDVVRLKRLHREANVRALAEMEKVEVTTKLTVEEVAELMGTISASTDPSASALLNLPAEVGLWHSLEATKAHMDAIAPYTVFAHLFPHTVLTEDGRSQPEPTAEDDLAEARVARQRSDDAASALMFAARIVVPRLAAAGRWSPAQLTAAVAIGDADLATAVAPGFEALERGEFWLAIHTLVPQLERAIRVLADLAGDSIESLATDSGMRWKTLAPLLEGPGLISALGQDLRDSLDAVFTSQLGPNIRNDTAHGTLSPRADYSGYALMTTLAILAVSRVITAQPRNRKISAR